MAKQLIVSSNIECIDAKAEGYVLISDLLDRIDLRPKLKKGFTILENPVKKETFLEYHQYIADLTEKWVEHLGRQYGGVDYPAVFWRKVLSTWVYAFLFDTYIRYIKVKEIVHDDVYIVKAPYIKTFTNDSDLSSAYSYSDSFQSDLYGYIFEYFGKRVVIRNVQTKKKFECRMKKAIRMAYSNPKGLAAWVIKKYHNKKDISVSTVKLKKIVSLLDLKGKVLLVNSRMPAAFEEEFIKRSGGEIVPIGGDLFKTERDLICKGMAIDRHLRSMLFDRLPASDEFEKLCKHLIRYVMPMTLVEYMGKMIQIGKEICQDWNFRCVYHSAVSTELFNICCAYMAVKDVKVIDIQHSNVYAGIFYIVFSECMYQDEFLTWGWKPKNLPFRNIRPVSMSRLPKEAFASRVVKKEKYLLVGQLLEVGTSWRGYDFTKYVKLQKRFIKMLPERIRRHLVIRSSINDENCDLRLWCNKHYPYIEFEAMQDKPFAESVLESKLLISDHYGSAHIEAVVLGKPFVMFEAMKVIEYNPVIVPYIKWMKKLGIFSKDGSELAKEISNHEDVEEWLSGKEFSVFYNSYKREMTNMDNNSLEKWCDELLTACNEK